FANLAADFIFRHILEPKLKGPHSQRHQPPQPVHVRDDGIEGVKPCRCRAIRLKRHHLPPACRGPVAEGSRSKNGVPATGVEGAAISRISIRPASYASRPLAIALAKARAMRTGSAALA